MISYRGVRCVYLGLQRWRIFIEDFQFDIRCRSGISELTRAIDRWRAI